MHKCTLTNTSLQALTHPRSNKYTLTNRRTLSNTAAPQHTLAKRRTLLKTHTHPLVNGRTLATTKAPSQIQTHSCEQRGRLASTNAHSQTTHSCVQSHILTFQSYRNWTLSKTDARSYVQKHTLTQSYRKVVTTRWSPHTRTLLNMNASSYILTQSYRKVVTTCQDPINQSPKGIKWSAVPLPCSLLA